MAQGWHDESKVRLAAVDRDLLPSQGPHLMGSFQSLPKACSVAPKISVDTSTGVACVLPWRSRSTPSSIVPDQQHGHFPNCTCARWMSCMHGSPGAGSVIAAAAVATFSALACGS